MCKIVHTDPGRRDHKADQRIVFCLFAEIDDRIELKYGALHQRHVQTAVLFRIGICPV